jgi:hypothetical protein
MADYIVTGPDGKKYKMTADSPEALDHAVGQMFGGAAPTDGPKAGDYNMAKRTDAVVKAAPEPSLVDRIMSGGKTALGVVDQGVRGLVDGAANVLGMPGDVGKALPGGSPNAPVTMVGGLPFPTSDTIKAIPNKLNDWTADLLGTERPRQNPEGVLESGAHRIGEELGAMAVPAAGAIGTGARIGVQAARAAVPNLFQVPVLGSIPGVNAVANSVARLPSRMVEAAAIDPAKFLAKEQAAALAAGGGAAAVNEMSGKADAERQGVAPTGWQQAGDAAGAVTAAGALPVGKKLWDIGGDVMAAIFGTTRRADNVAKDLVVDKIASSANVQPSPKTGIVDTAPLADTIKPNEQIAGVVPGYKQTLAEATGGNAGIADAQQSRATGGTNSGMYTGRNNENTDALAAAVNRSAPDPEATPGQFRSALETERDARIGTASTARAEAEEAAARAVQPLTPTTTRVQRGEAIRGDVDTAAETARQATRDAYEASEVSNMPLNPSVLAQSLERTTQGLSQAERSFTPQGLIDRVAQMPADQPATLREATSLRTILVDQQRAALADPGRRYEARVLGQYIEAVEDVIGQGVSADQRVALDAARAARRAEAEAFELKGDPVAQMRARYKGGVPVRDEESVARLAAEPEGMNRVLQEADTTATRRAMRDEVLSDVDTSSAAGLRQGQLDKSQQLSHFPTANDQISDAIHARVRETTARGAEGNVLKEFGEDGRSVVAKYLKFGDERAEDAMKAVMRDNKPAKAIDDLMTFAGDDPQAVEGARKVFWNILQRDTRSKGGTTGTTDANTQPFKIQAFRDFINDPVKSAVAARLYRDNPEHLDNLKQIAEAMTSMNPHFRARPTNSSGTPLGAKSVMPTPETIASRVFAVERGVVSPSFAIVNVLGIMARKAMAKQHGAAIEKAIDDAFLNPEWAKKLLQENNPANRAALRRGAQGWKANEISTLTNLMADEEDPDKDVKKAVRR